MNNVFVFDTNSLVSASLLPVSVSRQALNKATENGKLAASNATLDEFVEVLFRKKFDKYFTEEERWITIEKIIAKAVFFSPVETITDCRDPKDKKFLELAICAKADCLIIGDKDLLILHPFRGIPIVNAFDFINRFAV